MFFRNRSELVSSSAPSDDDLGGKGRRTPTRREAELARRKRLKPPTTRKEAARLTRQRRYEDRAKARSAMVSGDDRYLPARDRGPVRRFARDFVDSRRGLAQYLLPILVVVLVLSVVNTPWAVTLVFGLWVATILGTFVDSVVLTFRLRRSMAESFPGESTRGVVLYALLRSSQLRRFRLPKPQVSPGDTIVPQR